jgi:hypothetical protein
MWADVGLTLFEISIQRYLDSFEREHTVVFSFHQLSSILVRMTQTIKGPFYTLVIFAAIVGAIFFSCVCERVDEFEMFR